MSPYRVNRLETERRWCQLEAEQQRSPFSFEKGGCFRLAQCGPNAIAARHFWRGVRDAVPLRASGYSVSFNTWVFALRKRAASCRCTSTLSTSYYLSGFLGYRFWHHDPHLSQAVHGDAQYLTSILQENRDTLAFQLGLSLLRHASYRSTWLFDFSLSVSENAGYELRSLLVERRPE